MVRYSIIIPTYNRRQVLTRTLDSLAVQTVPSDSLEVIVVDNGSNDGTHHLSETAWPWEFKMLQQSIHSPTEARNLGANSSRGYILVFLDDDICPVPAALETLIAGCLAHEQTICLGTLIIPPEILQSSIYARTIDQPPTKDDRLIPYSFCQTGLLTIKRADFEAIGGFHDPTGGWPNWDDVDFGYRAHQMGYQFLRISRAVGVHWDYSIQNLQVSYNRLYRASRSAPRLINFYPDIKPELPMFYDAYPINYKQDTLLQIIRKIARRASAVRRVLLAEEWIVKFLEKYLPDSRFLRPLYGWISGGYIYQGFKMGAADLRISSD